LLVRRLAHLLSFQDLMNYFCAFCGKKFAQLW
jgi:hypothetical protein